MWLSAAALPVVPWILGRDAYGTVQLAVGTVGWVFFCTVAGVVPSLFAAYQGSFSVVRRAAGAGTVVTAPPPRDFSSHGAARLARWSQLLVGTLPGPTDPVLLVHEDKDPLCSCAGPRCAGKLPRQAGLARVAELLTKGGLTALLFLSEIWIVAVSLPRTWSNAWSAIVTVFFIVGYLIFFVPIVCVRFSTNIPLLQLSRRVNRRAMRLALGSTMERYRIACASGGASGGGEGFLPGRDGYMALHRLLACLWRQAAAQYNASSPMLIGVSAAVVSGLLNVVFCSCLPAMYPIYLLYVGTSNFLVDLLNVSAANAQISDIRELYLDALEELGELRRCLVTSAPHPGPDPALLAAMDADAEVLRSYTDTDRYRSKVLGFPVTYGIVRTVLVTILTLVVALWSILRGLGVFLTMDYVCPSRP
ncbi:hypothetical protein DFJ74DRAFT_672101 [Hyaloraphidium curvatum]|nr:hypothetical protein DFJ74DRAFT_672101 [Hyaloraphidium curvatum]